MVKSDSIIEVFDRTASNFGGARTAYFNFFGDALVKLANIEKGQRVLDVGTGRGAVLLPSLKAVGPQGKVVGIDPSSKMLENLLSDIRSAKLNNCSLILMKGEEINSSLGLFDRIFFGFSIFFMRNATAVLQETKNLLKPKGKVLLSLWGQKPPLTSWVVDQVKELTGDQSGLALSAFKDASAVVETLRSCGFKAIKQKKVSQEFEYSSHEAWWESLWDHGTRAYMERLSVIELDALKNLFIKKANAISKDTGKFVESFEAMLFSAEN